MGRKSTWNNDDIKEALKIISKNSNNLTNAFGIIAEKQNRKQASVKCAWYGHGHFKSNPLHQAKLNDKIFTIIGARELPVNCKNFNHSKKKRSSLYYIKSIYENIKKFI